MQSAAFETLRPVPCRARTALVVRAAAAEAPPAQQIRIKLKSKHWVASNVLYMFLYCTISGLAMLRNDSTLTNYTRVGYEKENIGEAVEQVSAEQAGGHP